MWDRYLWPPGYLMATRALQIIPRCFGASQASWFFRHQFSFVCKKQFWKVFLVHCQESWFFCQSPQSNRLKNVETLSCVRHCWPNSLADHHHRRNRHRRRDHHQRHAHPWWAGWCFCFVWISRCDDVIVVDICLRRCFVAHARFPPVLRSFVVPPVLSFVTLSWRQERTRLSYCFDDIWKQLFKTKIVV